MPHGQAQVPQRVEEPLGRSLDVGRHLAVIDDHEVEVGEGSQLAAPVAAEGDEDDGRGGGALFLGVIHGEAEERGKEAVHEGRIGLDGLLAGGAPEMRGLEEVDVLREVLAEELEPQPAPALRTLGSRALEAPLRLRFHALDLAEQVRRHIETLHGGFRDVKRDADLDGAASPTLISPPAAPRNTMSIHETDLARDALGSDSI